MTKRVMLCHHGDITDPGAQGFDPQQQGKDTVFVVRQGGHYYAYADICPHYGDTSLPWKKDAYLDVAGENIVCAAHGALFNIRSGLCTSGPCQGDALRPIPVIHESDGSLWITLEDE
ncbi:MAG: Rieske 2Fe-2S domain-containing protein [Gammaproteobacteria bacterium]|nr:Rieske 2Fe-2S domain-containing protein [Gammaproteobacteria bacterium]